jgi:hypothetical protein
MMAAVMDAGSDDLKSNGQATRDDGLFPVEPFPMGLPEGLSYDCIRDLLDALDGPSCRS